MNWLARARIPLATIAAVLVAIDLIGLGLRLADENPDALSRTERAARARVTAPDAVVSSGLEAGSPNATNTTSGVLTPTSSGVFIGPVAPPVVAAPAPTGNPGNRGNTDSAPLSPAPPAPVVPLAQADVAVPALGVQGSVGVGDNSCTTLDLTLLALGDCPAPEGDGAVVLNVGGSLLGG